jgi:hypothetical protein
MCVANRFWFPLTLQTNPLQAHRPSAARPGVSVNGMLGWTGVHPLVGCAPYSPSVL